MADTTVNISISLNQQFDASRDARNARAALSIALKGVELIAQPGAENPVTRWVETACPQSRTMSFYWLGTPGLGVLARRLGHPLYKVGALFTGDIKMRCGALNAARYGGFVRDAADPTNFVAHEGFCEWQPTPNRMGDFATTALPPFIRIVGDLFVIYLPPAADPVDVDSFVRTALAQRELAYWAHTHDGLAACAKAGVDPSHLHRFSVDPATRHHETTLEIYAWHPRRDRALFVSILASAVYWASTKRAA